jgi:hypothetical protein
MDVRLEAANRGVCANIDDLKVTGMAPEIAVCDETTSGEIVCG